MDQPTAPTDPAALALVKRHLLRRLNPTTPGAAPDPEQEERREMAEAVMAALDPHDAAEAMLAAVAIGAADAALDGFARARQPGTSVEVATRLRASAFSAGRMYQSALRQLRPRPPAAVRKSAAKPAPEPQEAAPAVTRTIPKIEFFQPRDRFGKPIPLWCSDMMTPAQRKASLAIPRDPDLEAEALADEARLIAEQVALAGAAPDGAEAGPTGSG